MKRRSKLIVALSAAGLVFVSMGNFGCSLIGIQNVEEWPNKTELKEGRFEIRQYKPAIIARTTVKGEYDKASNEAFRRLAGYIFGKNTASEKMKMTAPVGQAKGGSEKIAMTAPVTMRPQEGEWEMTFTLPSKYTLETLPRPTDPLVLIETSPGPKVAVYRYTGFLRESDLTNYAPKLTEWAEKQGYKAASRARIVGYDPPWTIPFLRRNEIQIEVTPRDK